MKQILFLCALVLLSANLALAQDDRSGANDGSRSGQHDTGNGCCNGQVGDASDWSGGGDDLSGNSVGGDMSDAATAGGNY